MDDMLARLEREEKVGAPQRHSAAAFPVRLE
jgi:hypothetical protein